VLQKAVFQLPKGGLLHGKRPSIARQKATFWKAAENKAFGNRPTTAETKAAIRSAAGMERTAEQLKYQKRKAL